MESDVAGWEIPEGTFYFHNQPDVPDPRGRTRKRIGVW